MCFVYTFFFVGLVICITFFSPRDKIEDFVQPLGGLNFAALGICPACPPLDRALGISSFNITIRQKYYCASNRFIEQHMSDNT